ncbi:hypothetical protein KXS03_10955 [Neorhizobium petrolearium]|uniref:hypothetical protein n=2 Tax=Neorhizobium petrolearium TaxID=515361 RepID=UPI003F15F19A
MSRYKMMVVGDKDLLPPGTRHAWQQAGIELAGPMPPADFDIRLLGGMHGVLIDAACDAQFMFDASEMLEAASIPFLFVVPEQQIAARRNPHVLGTRTEDIQAIVQELLRQYDRGVRH